MPEGANKEVDEAMELKFPRKGKSSISASVGTEPTVSDNVVTHMVSLTVPLDPTEISDERKLLSQSRGLVKSFWAWLNEFVPATLLNGIFCLVFHTICGIFPVVLRRLQKVESLEGLQILSVVSFVLFLIGLPECIIRSQWHYLRHRLLLLFDFIIIICSLLNIYSLKFTSATYSTLILLSTPYWVAFINHFTLKEPISKVFYGTLVLTVVGSVMILSSDLSKLQFAHLTWSDIVGMLLATGNSVFFAAYMVVLRKCSNEKLPRNAIYQSQMLSCFLVPLILSFYAVDKWKAFFSLPARGWVWYTFYVGLMIITNFYSIWIVGRVGAPFSSLFLGWRFCSTVMFGWAILGEKLTLVFQYLGVVLVVVGTSLFLLLQQVRLKKPSSEPNFTPSGMVCEGMASPARESASSPGSVPGVTSGDTLPPLPQLQQASDTIHPSVIVSGHIDNGGRQWQVAAKEEETVPAGEAVLPLSLSVVEEADLEEEPSLERDIAGSQVRMLEKVRR